MPRRGEANGEHPDGIQRYFLKLEVAMVIIMPNNSAHGSRNRLGWIENGRKRLAKLKAELAADPDNKQKAFRVDVSQNHVDFQDRQLKRSTELIQMHEKRGTADRN